MQFNYSAMSGVVARAKDIGWSKLSQRKKSQANIKYQPPPPPPRSLKVGTMVGFVKLTSELV